MDSTQDSEKVEGDVYEWCNLDLTGQSDLRGLPSEAVVGGVENGAATYLGRVSVNGHWEAAKLNAWGKFGYAYFQKEYETEVGQVLIANSSSLPVWIHGAYGEKVENTVSFESDGYTQLLGRAFHKGRWIPGKVVPICHCIFFPYGGKELSSRRYQILSADLSWRRATKEQLPQWVLPVDSSLPSSMSNSIPFRHDWIDRPDSSMPHPASDFRLTQQSLEECHWEKSGEGDEVRHAVIVHHWRIGRVWIDDSKIGYWEAGWVFWPGSGLKAGLWTGSRHHDVYEVLTAERRRASSPMTYKMSLEPFTASAALTSPNDVFLVTKLSSGERPGAVVNEIMDELNASKRDISPEVREKIQALIK